MKNSSTVIRSVRIEKELIRSIERIARTRNVTQNSLISSALKKYVEWDNQTEKYGYVSVPHEIIQSLLDAYDDEKLASVAAELGPRLLNDLLQFWFKGVTRESFGKYISLVSKYGSLANHEFDSIDAETILIVRHRFGHKGSVFISNLYQKGLEDLLGIEAECDMSTNQVILRWKNINASARLPLG